VAVWLGRVNRQRRRSHANCPPFLALLVVVDQERQRVTVVDADNFAQQPGGYDFGRVGCIFAVKRSGGLSVAPGRERLSTSPAEAIAALPTDRALLSGVRAHVWGALRAALRTLASDHW